MAAPTHRTALESSQARPRRGSNPGGLERTGGGYPRSPDEPEPADSFAHPYLAIFHGRESGHAERLTPRSWAGGSASDSIRDKASAKALSSLQTGTASIA